MAEAITLAELAFRILILPSISRGTHFVGPHSGPKLRALHLVELWQVADADPVPLAQAFRLLDVSTVAGAVLRGMAGLEREGDPHRWTFPTLEALLPELRELAWQHMLAGSLLVEGIKGIFGKRHRNVLPAELPRLAPDWELSRLIRDGRDEFIDVRVHRLPTMPVQKAWREQYSLEELKAAAEAIAKTCGPGERPGFEDFWESLEASLPDVTRRQAQTALEKFAPHLKGQRGYPSTKSLP
jgi:hypothetical protein